VNGGEEGALASRMVNVLAEECKAYGMNEGGDEGRNVIMGWIAKAYTAEQNCII
jgi:hypothetical protein